MIRIRRYRSVTDRTEIARLNQALRLAHGVPYFFPDPEDPLSRATHVAEEDGKVVAAVTGRVMIEGVLTVDPLWADPLKKWHVLERLFRASLLAGRREGFEEAHAALPDGLESYAGLLERRLHFLRDNRTRLVLDLTSLEG